MSNPADLPKQLPDMDFTFIITVDGNITKKKYEGEFSFKIPNLSTRARIDKERARLNEGLDLRLDPTVLDVHAMYAYLKFTLTRVPKWFEDSNYGYDLHDANVITVLYRKVEAFEIEWMEKVWGPIEKKKE